MSERGASREATAAGTDGPSVMPSVMMPVVLGLVTAGLSWLRLDGTTRGTMWADDGVFVSERLQHGPVAVLSRPYGGYLHLLPRLFVDLVVGVVPMERWAIALTLVCCLAVGAVGALTFLCTAGLGVSLPARLALGAIPALVPVGPVEVLGNVANLHWYALWLVPWLLLAQPRRTWHGSLLGLVALVCALTEIQAVLFAPLLLTRLHDRRCWPVRAALVVGLVGQLVANVQGGGRTAPTGPSPTPADLVTGWLFNVPLPMWAPSVDGPGKAFGDHGWLLAGAAAAPFVVITSALAVCSFRSVRSDRRPGAAALLPVATLVVGATVPLVAGLVLNHSPNYGYDSVSIETLSRARPLRYGVVPAMCLIAIVVLAADRLGTATRWRGIAAGVLCTVTAAVAVASFHVDGTRRSDGPAWAPGVASASTKCQVTGAATADVPIAPARPRLPADRQWRVPLTCDALGVQPPADSGPAG